MNRKYEKYVPPTKSEALQNLTGGYEASEKQPKELQSLNEMDSVKQRLDNGENVSHMELLSYGFYQLNESKAANAEKQSEGTEQFVSLEEYNRSVKELADMESQLKAAKEKLDGLNR